MPLWEPLDARRYATLWTSSHGAADSSGRASTFSSTELGSAEEGWTDSPASSPSATSWASERLGLNEQPCRRVRVLSVL